MATTREQKRKLPMMLIPPRAGPSPVPLNIRTIPSVESRVLPRPSLRGAEQTARGLARSMIDVGRVGAAAAKQYLPTSLPSLPDVNPFSAANIAKDPLKSGYSPLPINLNQTPFQNVVAGSLNNVGEQLSRWNDWQFTGGPLADFFLRPERASLPPPEPRPRPVRSTPGVEEPVRLPDAGTMTSPRGDVSGLHPNVLRMWDMMTNEYGMNPAAASGVIARMQVEGGDPTLSRFGVGDSGTAFGPFQHRGERDAARRAFMAANPGMSELEASTRFAVEEEMMRGTDAGAARAWRELQGVRTPEEASSSFLHFERPAGYNPERFHPQSVAGWEEAARRSRELYSMLADAALPPLPPEVPMPPERPMPVGPDWSGVDRWAEEARPGEPPPVDMLWRTLAGMASGVANVDTRRPGAVGDILAALGAGGLQGVSTAEDLRTKQAMEYDEALQRYAGDRARIAADQAVTGAEVTNARGATTFENELDRYKTAAANRQNEFGYRTGLYEQNQPKLLEMSGGTAAVSGPNGIEFRQIGPTGLMGSGNIAESMNALGKVPNGKYLQLQAMGDTAGIMKETIKDIVMQGLGPDIFGAEEFQSISELISDRLPAGLAGDPKYQFEQISDGIAQALMMKYGNDLSWAEMLARSGHPGARLLVGQ